MDAGFWNIVLYFLAVCCIIAEAEDCPGGLVWNTCGSACTPTCDNLSPICIAMCVSRCECPRDYPIWHDNTCIKEQFCPNHCPGGLVWNTCGSACTPTCDNLSPICIAMCVARCECPRDYPIWHDNTCIKEPFCPNHCPAGQVWDSCGSACTPTCDNRSPICILMCVARCECLRDYPIWHDNTCIKEQFCPNGVNKCRRGLVWNPCGSACTPTCDNPEPHCRDMCRPQCECPPSRPIPMGDRCISVRQCHQGSCPENQIWLPCRPCQRTCEDPFPICPLNPCMQGESWCGCPPEKPILHTNICITLDGCPAFLGKRK